MIRRARDRCSDPAVIPAEAGTKRSLSPAHRRIHPTVIPAKAGTQRWVPAFTGMTVGRRCLSDPSELLPHGITRRRFLVLGGAGLILPLAPIRTARATPAEVATLIAELVGDGDLHDARVKLDLPVMVENGNSVAMTVSVDAPVGDVRSIDVFAEGNPLPHVMRVRFGPRAGAPRIATRIRLATSQTVIAVAKLADGSCWRDSVDLLVTLAACID